MTRLHLRASALMISGLLAAVSLSGCLDRGGLDSDDGGGTGGKADAGMGTGGSAPGTGGATSGTGGASTGTGGASTGTGGAVSGTGGAVSGTGGNTSSGGRVGSGGNPGTGGVRGTGGIKGTGGSMGTGGKTMCGPVCDIFCAYGNVIDANGCATCQCKPGPVCPAIGCGIMCPNGYVKDEKGCDVCKCNPDTKPCTPEECGPAPARTNIVICAAGGGTDPGGAAPQPPMDAAIVAPFVCQRNADGKCSWFSGGCRVCPAVTCTLACMNGFQVGADGCQICACKPPPPTSVCGGLGDPMTCAANAAGCTWLAPGCTEPALAAAGCYAKTALGCTSDAQCGAGHQCLKRVVNPCYNSACTACALTQTICQ